MIDWGDPRNEHEAVFDALPDVAGKRVPADHPLWTIKELRTRALAGLAPIFDVMYAGTGRPSIPPERLLESTLLMAVCTVRSERQFCDQLDYDPLIRWFPDMDYGRGELRSDGPHEQPRPLLAHDVAGEFFRAVVAQAKSTKLMNGDHFTVDGTLIESRASLESFEAKRDDDETPPDDPGKRSVDLHGEKPSNETHESGTDRDGWLVRKGREKEAKLSCSAHAPMENRNGAHRGAASRPRGKSRRAAQRDCHDRRERARESSRDARRGQGPRRATSSRHAVIVG